MENYYQTLGVENFASLEEIKTAYKKLAKRLHPDVNDGDEFFEKKFKEIQIAYDNLSDSLRKEHHDEILKNSFQIADSNFKAPAKEEPKYANSSPMMKRQPTHFYEKGRWVKRRRM
jgi:curved DNA-binding protein CbpA